MNTAEIIQRIAVEVTFDDGTVARLSLEHYDPASFYSTTESEEGRAATAVLVPHLRRAFFEDTPRTFKTWPEGLLIAEIEIDVYFNDGEWCTARIAPEGTSSWGNTTDVLARTVTLREKLAAALTKNRLLTEGDY